MKKRKDIYSPKKWSQSFTYNRWTCLTCSDILRLVPYEEACKNMPFFPSGNSCNGLSTFFFLNHPINYILVTARCIEFVKKTDNFWLTEVEDGTGSELRVALFKVVPDKLMEQFTGKVIEIKGYIKETKMYGRQVNALDIRVVGEDNVVDLALAPLDALEVRGHVLGAAWNYDKDAKQTSLKSAMPVQYCSLMKYPSSLQDHKLFASKVKELDTFNAKRTVSKKKSLLEQLGIAVPWATMDSNDDTSGQGNFVSNEIVPISESNGKLHDNHSRPSLICLPGLDPHTMEELDAVYDTISSPVSITFHKKDAKILSIQRKHLTLDKDKDIDDKNKWDQQVDNTSERLVTIPCESSIDLLIDYNETNCQSTFIQFNTDKGTLVNIHCPLHSE